MVEFSVVKKNLCNFCQYIISPGGEEMGTFTKSVAFLVITCVAVLIYIWMFRTYPEFCLSNIGAAFALGLGMGTGALLGHIFTFIDRKK